MVSRLRERYDSEIKPALRREFSYPNVMQVPRLHKVSVNIGMGEAIRESKTLDAAVRDVGIVTGQHPVIHKAKKSIAGFHLREGMPIGVSVTLRGDRMYEFVDRLISR